MFLPSRAKTLESAMYLQILTWEAQSEDECSQRGGRGRELFSGPGLGLLLCATQEDLCMERWFPSAYV